MGCVSNQFSVKKIFPPPFPLLASNFCILHFFELLSDVLLPLVDPGIKLLNLGSLGHCLIH